MKVEDNILYRLPKDIIMQILKITPLSKVLF